MENTNTYIMRYCVICNYRRANIKKISSEAEWIHFIVIRTKKTIRLGIILLQNDFIYVYMWVYNM